MPLINVAIAAAAAAEKSNSHILNTTKQQQQQPLPYHINNKIESNARLGAKMKKELAFCAFHNGECERKTYTHIIYRYRYIWMVDVCYFVVAVVVYI